MRAPSVTSQSRGSVTSLSPSEASTDVKRNEVNRSGFKLVLSRVAKGVKSIKKFLRNHTHQGTRSATPAASLAGRLSVDNIANAFPEQYRQQCLQYLEEAAQERYALPGAEKFDTEPKKFTTFFNAVFSKEFLKPSHRIFLQKELYEAEKQTLFIICNELHANHDKWEIGGDIDLYMHFLSKNNALGYQWVSASSATETLDARNEDAPQAPVAELATIETRALPAVSDNPLADWTPGMDLMSAPIDAIGLAAPLVPMPVRTSGDIIERVYRTNVAARKMLITANIGDTKGSRISFEAFSLRLDEMYRKSFENHVRDFHSQHYSLSEAANMAAEAAFSDTALKLRLETLKAGDEVGTQYAKDMLGKEEAVKAKALELLEGPGKLMTEEARSSRTGADKLLAGEPIGWATQGLPMGESIVDLNPGKVEPETIIADVLRAHTEARHTLATFVTGADAFSSRFDDAYQFYFEAACTSLLSDNLPYSEAANIAALSAFSAAALRLRDGEIGGPGYQYAQSMLNKEEQIVAMATRMLEGLENR